MGIRFMGINQILSSHISRNLKRLPMKPNIGIVTFLGIKIVRNHILRNLDVRSNVNSHYQKPHIRVFLSKFLSSFSHMRSFYLFIGNLITFDLEFSLSIYSELIINYEF